MQLSKAQISLQKHLCLNIFQVGMELGFAQKVKRREIVEKKLNLDCMIRGQKLETINLV